MYTIKSVNNLVNLSINYPIIIVDNNSPNNSFDYLVSYLNKNKNVFIFKSEKNGGYSYGNNFGIKKALKLFPKLKYICIMNPDVEIKDEKIFEELIDVIEEKSQYAAISPIMVFNKKIEIKRIGTKLRKGWHDIFWNSSFLRRIFDPTKYNSFNFSSKNKVVSCEVLPGSFFIIKRDIFEEINFFDENIFLYEEENILFFKLYKKGYKSFLSFNHFFYHKHEDTVFSLKKRYINAFILTKSQIYYYKKYYRKGIILLPLIIFSRLFNFIFEIPLISLILIFRNKKNIGEKNGKS
jgi:hypothetical protein